MASFTPSRIDTPMLDDPPVNGPLTPILIGSAACAEVKPSALASAAAASK